MAGALALISVLAGCDLFVMEKDGTLIRPPLIGFGAPQPAVLDADVLRLDSDSVSWVSVFPERIECTVVHSGSGGDQVEEFTIHIPGVIAERLFFAQITPGTSDLVIKKSDGVLYFEGNPNGSFSSTPVTIFNGVCSSNEANGLAFVDAEKDGDTDILIAGTRPDSLPPNQVVEARLLKNNGGGVFIESQTITLPNDTLNTLSVASGDINNDNKDEVVIAGFSTRFLTFNADGTLSYYNTLTGQAQETPPTPLPGSLGDVSLHDLNGDGRDDFVSTVPGGGVSVRLAATDGSLGPPQILSGTFSARLAIRDIDQDGSPDVLTLGNSPARLSVYPGSPSGTLGAPRDVDAPTAPWRLGVFEPSPGSIFPASVFSVHRSGEVVQTYLNTPGGLVSADRRLLNSFPTMGVLADADGDGYLDLITPQASSRVSFSLNAGDGSGLFKPTMDDRLARLSDMVALPPLDGQADARAAFGAATELFATAVVARLNSTSNPTDWIAVSTGNLTAIPTGVAAGDFDGDGLMDLAYSNAASTPGVTVFRQQAGGAFAIEAPIPVAGGAWTRLAVGDFDGQLGSDIVVADARTGGWRRLLANNGGGFARGPVQSFPPPLAPSVAVGDFNADGLDDVVIGAGPSGLLDASVRVLTSNGSGGFSNTQSIKAFRAVTRVAVSDIDADGRNDVLFTTAPPVGFGDSMLGVVLNGTAGLPSLPTSYHYTHSDARGIMVGDLKNPVGSRRAGAQRPSVLVVNINNTQPAEGLTVLDPAPSRVCLGDLNSDGLVDDLDFQIFVVAYDILDCADPAMPAGCPSDLNQDGLVDDLDFQVFVVAYDAVVCP